MSLFIVASDYYHRRQNQYMSLYIVTCDYYHRRQNPPPTKLSHLNIHNYSCDFQLNADYILCSYKIWLSMVWFGFGCGAISLFIASSFNYFQQYFLVRLTILKFNYSQYSLTILKIYFMLNPNQKNLASISNRQQKMEVYICQVFYF